MSNPHRGTRTSLATKKKRRYQADSIGSGQVSWMDVKAENIRELIDAVAQAGGAIRFGVSRDGGAYALGVYGDGPDTYGVYAADADGIEEHMFKLGAVFEAIKEEMA